MRFWMCIDVSVPYIQLLTSWVSCSDRRRPRQIDERYPSGRGGFGERDERMLRRLNVSWHLVRRTRCAPAFYDHQCHSQKTHAGGLPAFSNANSIESHTSGTYYYFLCSCFSHSANNCYLSGVFRAKPSNLRQSLFAVAKRNRAPITKRSTSRTLNWMRDFSRDLARHSFAGAG